MTMGRAMTRLLAAKPSWRAPARLAVDDDHLIAAQRRNHRAYPASKRSLDALWVEHRKDGLKGVGRGNALLQPQEAAQPIELRLTPLRHVREVVGAIQHRAHRHRQRFAQNILPPLRVAPVLQPFDHRRQLVRSHDSAKKPGNYTRTSLFEEWFRKRRIVKDIFRGAT